MASRFSPYRTGIYISAEGRARARDRPKTLGASPRWIFGYSDPGRVGDCVAVLVSSRCRRPRTLRTAAGPWRADVQQTRTVRTLHLFGIFCLMITGLLLGYREEDPVRDAASARWCGSQRGLSSCGCNDRAATTRSLRMNVAGGTDTITQAIKLDDDSCTCRPARHHPAAVRRVRRLPHRPRAARGLLGPRPDRLRDPVSHPPPTGARGFADTTVGRVDDPTSAMTASANTSCDSLAGRPSPRPYGETRRPRRPVVCVGRRGVSSGLGRRRQRNG